MHHDGLLHDLDCELLLGLVLPVAEEDLPEGSPADRLQDLEVLDGRWRASPGGRPGRRRFKSLLAKLEYSHLPTPHFASPQLLNQLCDVKTIEVYIVLTKDKFQFPISSSAAKQKI